MPISPLNSDRLNHFQFLKRIRIEQPQRRLEWGEMVLSIPNSDLFLINLRHPELQSPDHEIRRKAWAEFLKSDESRPYRVRA